MPFRRLVILVGLLALKRVAHYISFSFRFTRFEADLPKLIVSPAWYDLEMNAAEIRACVKKQFNHAKSKTRFKSALKKFVYQDDKDETFSFAFNAQLYDFIMQVRVQVIMPFRRLFSPLMPADDFLAEPSVERLFSRHREHLKSSKWCNLDVPSFYRMARHPKPPSRPIQVAHLGSNLANLARDEAVRDLAGALGRKFEIMDRIFPPSAERVADPVAEQARPTEHKGVAEVEVEEVEETVETTNQADEDPRRLNVHLLEQAFSIHHALGHAKLIETGLSHMLGAQQRFWNDLIYIIAERMCDSREQRAQQLVQQDLQQEEQQEQFRLQEQFRQQEQQQEQFRLQEQQQEQFRLQEQQQEPQEGPREHPPSAPPPPKIMEWTPDRGRVHVQIQNYFVFF
ncbi:MAG: hypothetical protein E6Q06_01930 [Candidatus Moraniibacteriota bacterium]|nr:MAG: hypothetical protein E6Q06_01930 [Candidatus Moranbacteria bacterium]